VAAGVALTLGLRTWRWIHPANLTEQCSLRYSMQCCGTDGACGACAEKSRVSHVTFLLLQSTVLTLALATVPLARPKQHRCTFLALPWIKTVTPAGTEVGILLPTVLAETTRCEGSKGILPLGVFTRRIAKRACIFVVFDAPEGLLVQFIRLNSLTWAFLVRNLHKN
jgi:hypothetical protein